MKKHKIGALKRTLSLIGAISICLTLTACPNKNPDSDLPDIDIPPPNNQTDTNNKPMEFTYEYKTDVSAYLTAITAENLFLVNKQTPCGDNYVPEKLQKLPENITHREIELDATAASALEAMIAEMKAYGITDVFVTSGYRSYEYQNYLYNYYFGIEKENAPTLSDEQIKEKVLSYSAYPGTSEHQSGLCVDLMTLEMLHLVNYGNETDDEGDKGFAETKAFTWLKENAHKFGFILRYPETKTNLTGYAYESWHYRFVGREAASIIHYQNITLEEYLTK